MGWMSGWNSRSELVNHLTDPQKWEKDGQQHELRVVKKCFRGNNLWTIVERFVDGKQTDKFIILFMLRRFDQGDWGYKDVDESMGPVYYNCPVSWLDEVPDPGSHATAWREEVRNAASKVKSFKHGQRVVFDFEVRFGDGGETKELMVEKYRRRVLFRRPDGVLCRLSRRLQQLANVVA